MAEALTHWERIQATLEGGPLDHPAIALWRHWPDEDQDASAFAQATLGWQAAYDFDLVKITPNAPAAVADWGVASVYEPNANGIRTTTVYPVQSVADWGRLRPLDPASGHLGREVDAARRVAAGIAGSAPVLQTVFSPLTLARKLAGDVLFDHLAEAPARVEAALDVITKSAIGFARACLKTGVDGIYFATQCATRTAMDEAAYERFGVTYDMAVLDAIRDEVALTILHVHGEDILFDRMARYPVDVLNWHDRRTAPDLGQGASLFKGVVAGGLDEVNVLVGGSVAAIRAQARDAITTTSGHGLIVGSGCVLPLATPEAHVRAAIAEVRGS